MSRVVRGSRKGNKKISKKMIVAMVVIIILLIVVSILTVFIISKFKNYEISKLKEEIAEANVQLFEDKEEENSKENLELNEISNENEGIPKIKQEDKKITISAIRKYNFSNTNFRRY